MSCIGISLKIKDCEGEEAVMLHAMSSCASVNKIQTELHLLILLSLLFTGKNKNLLCSTINIGYTVSKQTTYCLIPTLFIQHYCGK